ncbi:MAG: indole-3-glycerol phosphate synthase TrpC [Candidatus Neomarinimicrobiota bacterium]|nr:indole-3-glycerol phosphate synthase TrpC [Candidatus Neomarinimicrobiota bacterium]|tara:strand:- start:1007 stop:1783 length:777 start_codon:yes stop_codon:yes gene_type:complete
MNILEKIIENKKLEVEERSKIVSLDRMRDSQRLSSIRNFSSQLKKKEIQIIAEIKRRSPALGDINMQANPALIAQNYASHGAACISVLTDQNYFGGQLQFIHDVKSMVDIPILRKDFIISEYQVWESFHAGADAILLIADIMEMEMLKDLHDLACELGLHVLVETHNESHFRLFDEIKPSMIGFNCRDLQTMKTDINFFKKIMLDLPGQPVWVAESGISSFEDLKFVFELGFNAALVGTHLMSSDDPGVALSNLLRSA